MGKLVAFAAEQEGDPTAAMIAQLLAQHAGKDHVKLTVTGIPNGFKYRLEAEEGVLKALGKAGAAAGGLGGPPGGF